MDQKKQSDFWNTPLTASLVKSRDVGKAEMLLGYFIGPIGGLLSSGIFTSILNTYFTDVLKLDLTFLTSLQLISTIFYCNCQSGCGAAHRADKGTGRKGKTLDFVICADLVRGIGFDVYRAV